MSEIIAYYGCEGCGDDRSYPQELVGIDQNGLLWCYDCPEELFHDDDSDKPVLQKFLTSEDRLREAAKRAKVLLDDATYHDGRYDQHTSPEWQKEACEVSGLLLEPVKEGG
jgi:hypothetical protein